MTRQIRSAIAVALCGAVATAVAARGRVSTPTKLMPVDRSRTASNETREATAEIPKLRLARAPTEALRGTARDLFAFRESMRTDPTSQVQVRLVSAPPPVAAATSPDLVLSLVGIAADGTGDNVVRTAIVTSSDELFLVKEGELLTPRYLVLSISENATEVRDLIVGADRRLTLK